MKAQLINWVIRVHTKLFGYPPSEKMRGFLKHLSWSFIGVIGSAVILFVIGISAGRILGPVQFGLYSLSITLANIIGVIGDFGFDQASLKYTSENKGNAGKGGRFFSVSFRITIVSSLSLALVLVLSAPFISAAAGLDRVVMFVAAPYAVMLATRQSVEAFIRARGYFRAQALIKLLEAILTLVLFVVVIVLLRHATFNYYVGILSLVGFVTMLIYFFRYARQYFEGWDASAYQIMRRYAFSSVYISIIGLISTNVDRFFLNHSLGAGEVGIYSAYLLMPSTLASYFTAAFINVFFPTMNSLDDRGGVLKRVDRLSVALMIPITLVYFVIGWVVLQLLGSQYRFEPLYLAMTALYGFLLIYLAIIAAVIGSSEKMFVHYARFLIAKPILLLATYVILSVTGTISIPALIIALIAGVLIDIILLKRSAKMELYA